MSPENSNNQIDQLETIVQENAPNPPEQIELTDFAVAKKLIQLKQSADSRGVEFNLSFKTVKKLLMAKVCYYTKKPFGDGLQARSIDRVNSKKGYVEGNVVPCTVEINQKKSNLDAEDIILMAKRIIEHQLKHK
jgi:hypothetical protein